MNSSYHPMPNKEFLRLRAFELARKRAFKPTRTIVSKAQAKSARYSVKQGRKKRKELAIAFQDTWMQPTINLTP